MYICNVYIKYIYICIYILYLYPYLYLYIYIYVGQTVAAFRYRWNNYKDNCRKHSRNEDCMQKHLYDHYLSCNNGFLNMVSVTFIHKTDPSNPLEREQYWRHVLQTNAPHGLNIADGV